MPAQNTPVPKIKLIECPRDAMQGWKNSIATDTKIEYINELLKVGFDTLDFGSFVSAKAIPQMADTRELIGHLSMRNSTTKLLAVVANARGAEEAVMFDKITYLGFPLSVSATFQMRNTNSSIEASFITVEKIQQLCIKNNKQQVVYLSMGFGNPYGDKYDDEMVISWVDKLAALDVKIVSLADTVGLAEPSQISSLLHKLLPAYPKIEIGVHLHSTPANWQSKTAAAFEAGCERFDGALKGFGGCPMANDDLVGNVNTELMIPYFEGLNILPELDKEALQKALVLADQIFV